MGKITTNSYILDSVKNGIKMVFLTAPVCDFYPHKMQPKQDSDIIQAEICKLLSKGVILLYLQREKMMILFQTFLLGRKEMTHTG